MPFQYELACIGAGNMAEGIAAGILRQGVLQPHQLIASDVSSQRRALFAERFGIAVTEDNRHAVERSRVLLLAVKPQHFADAARHFADAVRDQHVLISIMAGVPTITIEQAFPGTRARVVRVMPNLPITLGAGVAGICGGRHARPDDVAFTRRIFDAGGRSVSIEDEGQMDAVTALSGSGPAYFYLFTEALIAGGVRAGLPRETAELLAKQTCLGAARMMLESGEPPGMLREKVTSKGGTTEAALESLEAGKVFEQIVQALLAAFDRGRALGRT